MHHAHHHKHHSKHHSKKNFKPNVDLIISPYPSLYPSPYPSVYPSPYPPPVIEYQQSIPLAVPYYTEPETARNIIKTIGILLIIFIFFVGLPLGLYFGLKEHFTNKNEDKDKDKDKNKNKEGFYNYF